MLAANFIPPKITGRASAARGQAKTISKPYIVTMYDLDSDASKREIRNKVEELLDSARFIYKVVYVA